MKRRLGLITFNFIYPTASRPGRFYGTTKLQKIEEGCDDVNQLPIRPIISNIETATYKTSKYLAQLLAPLTKSKYTINSTNDFIDFTKNLQVGQDHDMISFDVTNLFTNVPLDFTINLILEKVYKRKLVKTKLKKSELKGFLDVCTKDLSTNRWSMYGIATRTCIGQRVHGALRRRGCTQITRLNASMEKVR